MTKLSYNNFIKGKNTDTNPEYIDSSNYTDAKNLVGQLDGKDGSLVPFKGVSKFVFDIDWRDTGRNLSFDFQVIATHFVPTKNVVYYFLTATGIPDILPGNFYYDEDFILMVDELGNIEVILGGFDLNFNVNREYSIDYVSVDETEYLFWTDNGFTGPRFINIPQAIAEFTNVKKAGGTVSTEDFNTFISLIKKPPQQLITYKYISVDTIPINLIWDSEVIFKYRYFYKDGSISAFTPVSKYVLLGALDTPEYQDLTSAYNVVELTYNVDNSNVQYIEIAFRFGDLDIWNVLDKIPSKGIGPDTIAFDYTTPFTPLGETANNTKYYDNVPITALSQAYMERRLIFGGYRDGYDPVEDLNVTVAPYYTGFAANAINVAFGTPITTITIDLLDIQAVTKEYAGNSIDFNIIVSVEKQPAPDLIWAKATTIFTVNILDYASLLATISALVVENTTFEDVYNQDITGQFTVTPFIVGTVLTIEYRRFGGILNSIDLTNQYYSTINATITQTDKKTYKSGMIHNFGIVYYDEFNRQGTVTTDAVTELSEDPTDDMYVKRIGERSIDFGELNGIVYTYLNILSIPPAWAHTYQIVYSYTNNLPLNYIQINTNAYAAPSLPGQPNNRFYLSALKQFKDRYDKTPLQYSYSEGDIFYLLGGYDTVQAEWTYEFPDTPPFQIIAAGVDDTTFVQWIEIGEEDFQRLDSIDDLDLNGLFIEIRSAETINSNIYYEFGDKFNISNPGKSIRKHEGSVSNQTNIKTLLEPLATIEKISPTLYLLDSAAAALALENGDSVLLENGPISYYGTVQFIDADNVYLYFHQSALELTQWDVYKYGAAKIILTNGNSYYHQTPFNAINKAPTGIQIFDTESQFVSNYLPLGSFGVGRIQIKSTNFREVFRFASLLASEQMQVDTNFFGLTSFPNNSFPFKDLDNNEGQITALVSRDTDLVILQETRCGRVLINKDVLTTGNANQSVSVTDDVFGQYVPYFGNVGIGKSFASLQYARGKIFFISLYGAIYQLGNDGLTDVSAYGMNYYFENVSWAPKYSAVHIRRDEYFINTENNNAEVFAYDQNQWMPSIEVQPDKMDSFVDFLVSFVGVNIFFHEQTENYNQLFDSNGDLIDVIPSVSLVANDEKIKTKVYESIELAGSNLDLAQIVDISTEDATSSDVDQVEILESSWVAPLKAGKYTKTLGSEYIGVGHANQVISNQVRFDNPIDTTSIAIGDELYRVVAGVPTYVGTIISFQEKAITTDISIFGVAGDMYLVMKSSDVAGSDLRGLYLKMTIQVPSQNQYFRINSVSAFNSYSELHEK